MEVAAYGMLASYALQVIMFPFTFYFNNSYSIAYLFAWGIPGWYGGVAVDLAVVVLLSLAIRRHGDYENSNRKEMGAALGTFIAWEILMGFLAYHFFWDTVIYM